MTGAQLRVLKVFDELYKKKQWKGLTWIAEQADTSTVYPSDVLRRFRSMQYKELIKTRMSRHNHQKQPYPEKLCVICELTFHPRWPNQVTCSAECSLRWRYKKNSRRSGKKRKAKNALPKIKVCQQCFTEYIFAHRGRLKYCSDACAYASRLCQQAGYRGSQNGYRTSFMGKCVVCGVECVVHQNKKTCGVACGNQLRKNRQERYREEGRYQRQWTDDAARNREHKYQQQLEKDLDTLRRFIDEQSGIVAVG